jgi:hypothetical protein
MERVSDLIVVLTSLGTGEVHRGLYLYCDGNFEEYAIPDALEAAAQL